jgi:predicted ester cyclase
MCRRLPDGIMHRVDPLAAETSVGKEEEEQAPVSVEENKALVCRFFEPQAKGDLDAVREMMAPDFVDHSLLPGQTPGREGYLQSVAEDSAAFSDVRNIFEEQLIDGDKVISRISTRVLHDRGEYFGLMPAGKEYEVSSITIHRVVGGKIARSGARVAASQG